MHVAPLSSIGLVMQESFNSAAHNKVNESLVAYKETHFSEWMSFMMAWNGVAYRYKAALSFHQSFTGLIRSTNSPPPEERFEQEHALFGFFSSALSSLECYYYALYCVGAMQNSAAFPAASPKDLKVYPVNVKDRFLATFPSDPITAEMQSTISDPMFAKISDIRNVLNHRGTPPRHYFRGGDNHGKAMTPSNPKDPAAQWNYSFDIDGKTTEDRWVWVSERLFKLLDKAEVFCNAHMVV